MAESLDLQTYLAYGMHLCPRPDHEWHRPRPRQWRDPCVPSRQTVQSSFAAAAKRMLKDIPGIEAAFLTGDGEHRRIIVVALEHDSVDRERLLDVEDDLSGRFGATEVCVRAHQGRGIQVFE